MNPDADRPPIFLPDLRDQFQAVWRRKWLIFIAAAAFTAAFFCYYTYSSKPSYQSSSEILQHNSGIDKALAGAAVDQNAQQARDVQDEVELITSPQVDAGVIKSMGDRLEGRDPASMVNINLIRDTNIVKITATASDARLAADIANAFAAGFIAWQQQAEHGLLEQASAPLTSRVDAIPADEQDSSDYETLSNDLLTLKIMDAVQANDVEIVKPAQIPASPVSPGPLFNGTMGLLLSLVLSVGGVMMMEQASTRITSADAASQQLAKPVLAIIPGRKSSTAPVPVTISNPAGAAAEAYRLLCTNLAYARPGLNLKSIMVTSAGPAQGKTETIANLAVTMARSGKRIILLEADFRGPRTAKLLRIETGCGLTDVIRGTKSLKDCVKTIDFEQMGRAARQPFTAVTADEAFESDYTEIAPLRLVAAGPLPPNPGELSASDSLGAIIESAGEHADLVLVDAPPICIAGDAGNLAGWVDGILLTISLAQTRKRELAALKSFTETTPGDVLGLIVHNAGDTDADSHLAGYYSDAEK